MRNLVIRFISGESRARGDCTSSLSQVTALKSLRNSCAYEWLLAKFANRASLAPSTTYPLDETKHRANASMNAAIEAGYDTTFWKRSNEFLRISISPRHRLHPLKGELKGLVGCDGTS